MKPSAYKHVAAWGRHFDMDAAMIRKMQRIAAREDAPVDATYRTAAGWVCIADVGVRTRMAIEVELNRGARK